jgi:peptidyl-tRNA hydrolase, PTH1 family
MFDLIVAVGNPGLEYEQTKHNVAWTILDEHPDFRKLNWKSKFKGHYAEAQIGTKKIWLLKPQTYMNLSGESVQPFCQFYKISPEKVLVLHDELDIPLGQIHFKMGGGLAGHNGLKSIAAHLGTENFARMRIGIGKPIHGSVSDWVLSPFRGDDLIIWKKVSEKCMEAVNECVLFGINTVSGKWNKKNLV